MQKISISRWWLNQPIWKICSSNWKIFPKVRGENKKNWNHQPDILNISRTRHPETTRKVTFKKKRFLSGSRTYNFCSGPEILVSVFFGPEILVSVFWDPECWVLNHPDLKESSSCLAYSLWWCGLRLWRCGGLLFFCCCGRSMIECLVFGAIFWWDLRLMD